MDVAGYARKIFFEKCALILYRRAVRHGFHAHSAASVFFRVLSYDLVFRRLRLSPDTAHLHLRDYAAVTFPFCKGRGMRMPAQHYRMPFGKLRSEMTSCSGFAFVCASMEKPSAALLVHREYRPWVMMNVCLAPRVS